MTVRCRRCGQEWKRDPALEVKCPVCDAGVGQRCQRPSGYRGPFVRLHAPRDRMAMEQGFLQPCRGSVDGEEETDVEETPVQVGLFAVLDQEVSCEG